MDKQKLQPLKGFRDFLPDEAKKRQWLKKEMVKVFESWGYEPIETPTLEPLEIFEGEIGEDEKLFYKFKDLGGREVALRYDQTVPTVRFIGNNLDKITFPFKRYQIQSTYRAEKPQKGRFREFVQADADIYGIDSPTADAEVIAICIDLYRKLGFEDVLVLINSRELMKDIPYKAIVAIDKLDKTGESGVIDDMIAKGISKEEAESYLNKVKSLKPNDTIRIIFNYLEQAGFDKKNYQFKPTLARSFSYSEGPIWEITIPGYAAGSVGGGERYDAMLKRITGYDLPATGVGLGFDRTLEALEQFNLIPELPANTKVLITVFNEGLAVHSIKVASSLRKSNVSCEVYPDFSTNLDKQLKYANKKGIPWAVIIGPEEVDGNKVLLKNMQTGDQTVLESKDLVKNIT